MPGKKYETVSTQVEYGETFNTDAHMFFCKELIEEFPDTESVIMTQLYLKEGMKRWKGKVQAGAKSQMNQLHLRDNFKLKNYIELNTYQKNIILESHMFTKEVIDGKIKYRNAAGRNKQRESIPKEDFSSTTVANKAMLLSCIIDAE